MNWHLAFKLTLGFTIGLLVGKILIDWATSPRLISLGSLTTPFVDQKYLRDIYTNRTKIPDYVRGKNQYQWLLNTTDLDNGISYLGAHNRLRVAMDKLRRGRPIKVATIGGSITAGQGAIDAPNWPQYVLNYMKDNYGEDAVQVVNGAVGGTVSSYMSVCHNIHVPQDADIVFVEYSVNDWTQPIPAFQNNIRRGFERLIRKLLKYPNKPAVIIVHAFIWFYIRDQEYPQQGAYWNNVERELNEFALYYHLPSLSLKAATYERMVANEVGFWVDKPRDSDPMELANKAFYFDVLHPDGRTGARVMAELAVHLMDSIFAEVAVKPVAEQEAIMVSTKDIPRPMIHGNWESVSDKCFIGQHFTDSVQSKKGFEWINESKGPRPKWGYVSTVPGSELVIMIDTRASASKSNEDDASSEVLVELAYLRSYESMGSAEITCEVCTCQPSIIEGHQMQKHSLINLQNFYASQSQNCTIVVTVRSDTLSGKNKVKVTGIMISDETGQQDGIKNHLAVEYVSDISSRSKDGIYEINNHARMATK